MVDIFGKEVLIEHKEDYAKIVKAYEEYKKEKENNLLKEEIEESISNNEFMSKIKDLLIKEEKIKTNKAASNLYYENELGGLNFSKSQFSIYGKPKKRTGPKSIKSSRIITEEITRDL